MLLNGSKDIGLSVNMRGGGQNTRRYDIIIVWSQISIIVDRNFEQNMRFKIPTNFINDDNCVYEELKCRF